MASYMCFDRAVACRYSELWIQRGSGNFRQTFSNRLRRVFIDGVDLLLVWLSIQLPLPCPPFAPGPLWSCPPNKRAYLRPHPTRAFSCPHSPRLTLNLAMVPALQSLRTARICWGLSDNEDTVELGLMGACCMITVFGRRGCGSKFDATNQCNHTGMRLSVNIRRRSFY
jgi:hypothetical protein